MFVVFQSELADDEFVELRFVGMRVHDFVDLQFLNFEFFNLGGGLGYAENYQRKFNGLEVLVMVCII